MGVLQNRVYRRSFQSPKITSKNRARSEKELNVLNLLRVSDSEELEEIEVSSTHLSSIFPKEELRQQEPVQSCWIVDQFS